MEKRGLSRRDKQIAAWIASLFAMAVLSYISQHMIVIRLFQMMVFGSGLALCLFWFWEMRLSLQSFKWPKVSYKIEACEIEVVQQVATHHLTQYHPYFSFSYEYQGQNYQTNSSFPLNLAHMPVFYQEAKAKAYLEQVRAGLYGDFVWVNPKNPAQAFMRPGINRDQWGMFVFGLLLALLPALTYFELVSW